MQVTIEVGSYKLRATRQRIKKVWLVQEFSGSDIPFNTYGTTEKDLVRTLKEVIAKES